jgi:anti-sigma B factor antagonist
VVRAPPPGTRLDREDTVNDYEEIAFYDAEAGAPPPAAIGVVRRDGIAVLSLEGELDVYTASALRDRLAYELDVHRPCVIDLRRVSFIDSSILSALLAAQRRSAALGLAFVVVLGEERSPVRRLIEVAMVTMRTCDDLDEAIDAARLTATGRQV